MALPVLPLMAIAAIAMFAGGGAKKSRKRTSARMLAPGDVCDVLDQSNVPPGFGCYAASDGVFHVMAEWDPAKSVVDYGEFGDQQGVEEALTLLGFDSPTFQANVARFQDYAHTFFGLGEGKLRFDGRLDTKTVSYLSQAIKAFEEGKWVSEADYVEGEALEDFEYENAVVIVGAWQQDPLFVWEFPSGEEAKPLPGGQSTSSWLANLVYWGTYDVGSVDEPGASMPKKFTPVPNTPEWEAQTPARNIWLRVHQYVQVAMEEAGVPNETVFPENA